MSWQETFFSGPWFHLQERLYPPERSAQEAAQIAALLGLGAGSRVLDVPCGTGRIALCLAEQGMAVVGVDRTARSLELAREAAAARGVALDLREGDMRTALPQDGSFDAVINFWGSFGYFDHAGNQAFLRAAAGALRPGGRLLIDSPSLESLLPHWQARAWYEIDGMKVLEERSFEPLTGRNRVVWTFISADGQQATRETEILIYSASELTRLAQEAGFSAVALYGRLDGSPFAIGSRMVLVATV